MKLQTALLILISIFAVHAPAQVTDISPVNDATLPETSERSELGRANPPGISSGRALRERRREIWKEAAQMPNWRPSATPQLYPLKTEGVLGELTDPVENSVPSALSR